MSIDLPQTSITVLPAIPKTIKDLSPELNDYLVKLNTTIQGLTRGHFNNDLNITTVISSGTSGSFVIHSGGHILVTSGIVTAVSTT